MGVEYHKTRHPHWPYTIVIHGAKAHELVEWTPESGCFFKERPWYWLNALKQVPVWGWIPWWLGGTQMPAYGYDYYDDREIQMLATGQPYTPDEDLSRLTVRFARKDDALLFKMTFT